MSNSIYDIDLTRALPPTLKSDPNMLVLGKVIAERLQENIRLSRLNIVYDRIDELPENVLDILAYDMHIDWYDYGYPIETKRRVIKNSVRIHKRLGTKYAVALAIRDVFPESYIVEWFQYGGGKYLFRLFVDITGQGLSEEQNRDILRKVFFYKNLRSHLDEVIYTTQFVGNIYLAASAPMNIMTTTFIEPEPPPMTDTVYVAGMASSVTTTELPEPEDTPPPIEAVIPLHTGVRSITTTIIPEPPEKPQRAFLRGVDNGETGQAILEDAEGAGMAYLMTKPIKARGGTQ
ncbi:MAG: phage tail protein I [Clostridiales bacterium]|nr:phage tail protein I [Clostridiales bacterium]